MPFFSKRSTSLKSVHPIVAYSSFGLLGVTMRATVERSSRLAPSGFDPARYVTRLPSCPVADGEKLGVALDGCTYSSAPCRARPTAPGYVVEGSSPPTVVLVDRGFVLLIAPLCAAGPIKVVWTRQDAAQAHPIPRRRPAEGYTVHICLGRQAPGGLLMRGLVNRAPELFAGSLLEPCCILLMCRHHDGSQAAEWLGMG